MTSYAELKQLAEERQVQTAALRSRELEAQARAEAAKRAEEVTRGRQAAARARQIQALQKEAEAVAAKEKEARDKEKQLFLEAQEKRRAEENRRTLGLAGERERKMGARKKIANAYKRAGVREEGDGKNHERFLTLEERKKRRLLAEFSGGSRSSSQRTKSPAGRNSPMTMPPRAGSSSTSATTNGRSTPVPMVALGTVKRDNRSIDEIERDIKAMRAAVGKGESEKERSRRLAAEELLERRKIAIAEKRGASSATIEGASSSSKAKGASGSKKRRTEESDSSDDSLFSDSDDDEAVLKRARAADAAAEAAKKDRRAASPAIARSMAVPPRPRVSHATGIDPRDFLPGAPLRGPPPPLRDGPKKQRLMGGTAKKDTTGSHNGKRSTSADEPAKSGPPAPRRPETEREKFIRLEREAKEKAAGLSKAGKRQKRDISSDEESQEDEFDSGEGDRRPARRHNHLGEEIWQIFGKDRSKYASARYEESDDEDDGSDMEADASAVLLEEMRSAKRAREEDAREEAEERKRAELKRKRLGR